MSGPFAPGDVVECIDAGPCKLGYVPDELVEGAHYTVYAVGVDLAGDQGVFLDEQESECWAGGYLAWRFRKVGEPVAPDRTLVTESLPA